MTQIDETAQRPTLSAAKRALLEQRLGGAGQRMEGTTRSIPRRPPDAPPVVSFAQQRLWFLSQLEPESAAYNVSAAARLVGTLHVEALERSLDELVRRHEVLRTTFQAVRGRPAAVVKPPAAVALPCDDLRALPSAEREAAAHQTMAADARQPFDLARGPLLRARLLQLGDQEHILAVMIHHIVSDGWSTGIFVRELASLYTAVAAGRPSPLADLPLQYADFAHWQHERMKGALLETDLAYWTRQLAGSLPALQIPTDRPRPALPTGEGATRSFRLPTELSAAVKDLSLQTGTTPFMILLAAFKTLLYRYTGQTDIVVGTPIANRSRPEFENLIGLFANMLPLRTDLSDDPPFRELLQRVREVALDVHAHQELPFEKLVEILQPERNTGTTPLERGS